MANGQHEMALQDLQSAWSGVARSEAVKDPNTQWLVGQMNLRVDALKALKLVYLTTKFYLKGKLALATGILGPQEIGALTKDLFDVAVLTLDSLREQLEKSTYTACVVLAGHPDGLTPVELERELKAFVDGADAAKLPFYMGFTESFLNQTRDDIGSPGAFGEILDDLRKGKWVSDSDGRLFFKERHFVWSAASFS